LAHHAEDHLILNIDFDGVAQCSSTFFMMVHP